jgi:hypothetical protein
MIEHLLKFQFEASVGLPDDPELIQSAVEAAGVGEFDFFRAAWRAWHGAPAEEKALEQIFVAYLYSQKAPGFARHFARRVLDAEAAGSLRSADLGLRGLRRVQRLRPKSDVMADLTACAVFALVLIPFI